MEIIMKFSSGNEITLAMEDFNELLSKKDIKTIYVPYFLNTWPCHPQLYYSAASTSDIDITK